MSGRWEGPARRRGWAASWAWGTLRGPELLSVNGGAVAEKTEGTIGGWLQEVGDGEDVTLIVLRVTFSILTMAAPEGGQRGSHTGKRRSFSALEQR